MTNIFEINDKSIPELQPFAYKFEQQLLHWFEPDLGVFVAESPKVIQRALNRGYEPLALLMERKDMEGDAAEIIKLCRNIPIYVGDSEAIVDIIGFKLIRGALCLFRRNPLISAEEMCRGKRRIAVLENVVNPTNIGAIFRSAAALGMEAVLLTKGCCDPLYRRSSRVSMGTVFQVEWSYLNTQTVDVSLLHSIGYKTAAMALRKDSVSITNASLMNEDRLAVILGTEGDGLSDRTISSSDYTVCIPMSNDVDSLNVAAASAVAFWQLGLNNA